jgi:hypothetical protein
MGAFSHGAGCQSAAYDRIVRAFDLEKACAAVRCSRHRRTVNSFAHLSFERPRWARGNGGPMVFDRIGDQTVRPRACDAACRADPVCRYATKLAQQ